MEEIANGLDHSEGICKTLDGTLFLSGEAGQIYRIEPDDTFTEVAGTGGFTLGLAADGDGMIYACDPVKKRVFRVDPGSGAVEEFSAGTPEAPFKNPNWGAFDSRGNYYVSDSGGWKTADGRIYVVRPGQMTEVWSEESRDFPNGLAVTPDESSLWVLESTPGRMIRFPILDDGTAGPMELVADLPEAVPDGLAFAADGSVVISCYRPDIVYRWSEGSGLEVLGHDPEGTVLAAPTNVVFTGPDLDTLVLPNLGRWHATRFRVPGLTGVPLFYPSAEQLGLEAEVQDGAIVQQ
jgi:gluconolactonase